MTRRLTGLKLALVLLAGLAVLLVIALLTAAVGHAEVSLADALAAWRDPARRVHSPAFQIVFQQRLPRIALGMLVGFGLGVTGAAFQAILRNPLADPYTMGVATGSAVGAVTAISFPLSAAWLAALPAPVAALLWVLWSSQAASLLGAAALIALIYRLGLRRREFRVEALLLAGVTVALVGSAAILLIRSLANPFELVALDRWLMGGLVTIGLRDVGAILPLLLPGLAVLFQLAGAYNQLALGEELAFGRGVDAQLVQKWTFIAGSVVTAAVVSVAGPIGFVGLIVPHAVRRVVGPDHRLLLPAAGLAAAGFLVLCDTVARTVIAPTELPVGVVTAVVGGPIFVAILYRRAT